MALVQTITTASQLRAAFEHARRSDQFSPAALEALLNYYNDLDEQIELDVVGICCAWTEYDSAVDACKAYDLRPVTDVTADEAEREEVAIDCLQDEASWVIVTDSGSVLVSTN